MSKKIAKVSVLDSVNQKLAGMKVSKPKSKAEKWEMTLTEDAKKVAEDWVSAKTVAAPFNERLERSKDEFKEYAVKFMAEKIFENKSKPSNPLVVIRKTDGSVDHQFQFLMTDKFKMDFPKCPEDVEMRDHLVGLFIGLGLTQENAEGIVDEEINYNPVNSIRSLNDLLEGRYESNREWIQSTDAEKKAAEKLVNLIFWDGSKKKIEPLTEEEQSLIFDRSEQLQVKAGFYERVANYCENVEDIHAIFSVIKPVAYPVYEKFSMNDSEQDKANRMIGIASEILGAM